MDKELKDLVEQLKSQTKRCEGLEDDLNDLESELASAGIHPPFYTVENDNTVPCYVKVNESKLDPKGDAPPYYFSTEESNDEMRKT